MAKSGPGHKKSKGTKRLPGDLSASKKSHSIKEKNRDHDKHKHQSKQQESSNGADMSQVLSTFSAMEQERFAAFRRCTFANDAVSEYVASCLVMHSRDRERWRQRGLDLGGDRGMGIRDPSSILNDDGNSDAAAKSGSPNYDAEGNANISTDNSTNVITSTINTSTIISNKTTSSAAPKSSKIKPLSEYVAHGTSQRITMAVTTIAKIYAQRLVQSARELASQKGYSDNERLLPAHVLEAHRMRVRSGADPGLFMQPAPLENSTDIGNGSKMISLKQKLDEAMKAQEMYDAQRS